LGCRATGGKNTFAVYRKLCILWHIDPLVGKDLKTNNETTVIATERHSKRASTTTELLLETVFSLDPCKGVILKTTGATQLLLVES
jgi:hypothetical protein